MPLLWILDCHVKRLFYRSYLNAWIQPTKRIVCWTLHTRTTVPWYEFPACAQGSSRLAVTPHPAEHATQAQIRYHPTAEEAPEHRGAPQVVNVHAW